MEHFGGSLCCRRRPGFANFPRRCDQAGIVGSDLKTPSVSSIFEGRAIRGVEGWTLWLGEALGRALNNIPNG
jgi:hypothetical protein